VASYNTSEFRKGLKVQIEGDPYLMIECNFVKPGKGQALYQVQVCATCCAAPCWTAPTRAATRSTRPTSRKFRPSFSIAQLDQFVFMDNNTYDQYEFDQGAGGRVVDVLQGRHGLQHDALHGQPIICSPPNHVILRVEYCEPGARGNTAPM